MNDTVLVAIISGLCVGVPSIITTVMLNNKNQAVINAKVEDNQKFIDYKLQELSDRVDKHNNVVERIALQERETKALWKQVDKLNGKE